ncbi:unnamed protein product [Tilletia caries]|uniref:Uncharacterized protein n=1 Tax=Tilletia caries TaxID=13290 RepID=A0ABN7J3F3_9BASI|nr:unnamed protein product [Tilletia caries]
MLAFYGASFNPQLKMKTIKARDYSPYSIVLKELSSKPQGVFPVGPLETDAVLFGCAQDAEFSTVSIQQQQQHINSSSNRQQASKAAMTTTKAHQLGLGAYKRATRIKHHACSDEVLESQQDRSPPPLGPSSPALDLYLFRSSAQSSALAMRISRAHRRMYQLG